MVTEDSVESTPLPYSPYQMFNREEWARLRADTPMTLKEGDLDQLSGIIENMSVAEVEHVYLPLSRLLNLYVQASQALHSVSTKFLGRSGDKMPFIIGIAGSVAVGKSTAARVLRELLSRWPDHPRVDLITTDGFLWPNAELERRHIMHRKGFPESFNTQSLLAFLGEIKSGVEEVNAPVYSHFHYDIVPGKSVAIRKPDILIVEGINVLQTARAVFNTDAIPYVSDFFDFSIFLDADSAVIEDWYLERFMKLRGTAFQDPDAYFHRYSELDDDTSRQQAQEIWRTINLKNLSDNILPTRLRAHLILRKGADHHIESVALRKL